MAAIRTLVVIANYGLDQVSYLKKQIEAWHRISPRKYRIDYMIHSNIYITSLRNIPQKIHQLNDYQLLPYVCRRYMHKYHKKYDLLIYNENDLIYTQQNLDSYMEASSVVPEGLIPGFFIVERYKDGVLWYPQHHGDYKWDTDKVYRSGKYVFCHHTNEHHAGLILTSRQYRDIATRINMGKILRDKRKYQRNTWKVQACVVPYSRGGLTKVIPVSHFDEFLITHQPNKYRVKFGCDDTFMRKQINTIIDEKI